MPRVAVSFVSSVVTFPTLVGLALCGCGEAPPMPGEGEPGPIPSVSAEPVERITSALCASPPPSPVSCTRPLWPDGTIYYQFNTNLPAADRTAVRAAMDKWENLTLNRISFVPDTVRANRARISPGCSTSLGTQSVNSFISGGCASHELGHLIGLSHQHQRNDRNRNITVDSTLLSCSSFNDNVVTCEARSPGSDFGVFDRKSTMLYLPTLAACASGQTESCCPAGGSPSCEFIKNADGTSIPVDGTGPNAAPTAKDGSDALELYGYQLGWSKFFSLGKDVGASNPLSPEIISGVRISGSPALTTQGGAGILDSFFVGTDGHLYHRFNSPNNNPSWSGYFDMGLPPWDPNPTAASWGTGSVFVFAGDRGSLWMRQFAAGNWQSWTPQSTPAVGICSGPTAVSWGPGRLDLFVRGCDGEIWTKGSNNLSWGGWFKVSSRPSGVSFVNRVTATSTGNSNISLFVNASNGKIYQISRTSSGWGAQWTESGCCIDTDSSPAVAHAGSGKLDLVIKSAGQFWWRRFSGGSWTPFRPLGGMMNSDPAAVSNSANHVDVLMVGADGGPWHRWLN